MDILDYALARMISGDCRPAGYIIIIERRGRRNYKSSDLLNRQVIAVVNFAPKQIGKTISEVLVLGLPDENNEPILVAPSNRLQNAIKLY